MHHLCKAMSATLLIGLSALVFPQETEAQLLKKIGKGLDKVNKTLEKVEKAVNSDTKKKKEKTSQSSKRQGSASERQNDGARSTTIDDSSWEKAGNYYNTPFVSGNTRFLQVDNIHSRPVSDVNDGVFTVRKGQKYAFWTVDGRKLFDADWEYCSEYRIGDSQPTFNGGVAPAKRATANSAGKKPICLLYLDGRIKELPPSYEKVTTFADGLAMVTQKVNYKDKYFYINVRGEKMYPNLEVYGNFNDAMRPLSDGLRAYPAAYDKWGYIDRNGKIAISPRFAGARDFSEGYAWVSICDDQFKSDGELALIDKTGKIIFKPGIKVNSKSLSGNRKISDVTNGRFYIEKDSKTFYYDTSGHEIGVYEAGSRFVDGYAFVEPSSSAIAGDVFLVDPDFNRLKLISDKIVPAHVLEEYGPDFGPYGLATVLTIDGNFIIDPRGNVIVSSFDNHETGNHVRGFRTVSASGYALVTDITLNSRQYHGLMRPDGELAWLFASEPSAASFTEEEWNRLPLPVDPPEIGDDPTDPPVNPVDPPVDKRKWTFRIINIDMPPIGPTVTETPEYRVCVTAHPAEGGTVNLTPAGVYRYGDYATVTAAPNKDWAIGEITCETEGIAAPKLGEPFAVTSTMNLTVHFIKKDDDKDPPMTGTYQGSKHVEITRGLSEDVTYYARISSTPTDSTAYGKNTHGFIVAMFDPYRKYVGKDLSTYIFSAPLRISGYQHDDATGRDWLVADGGSWVFGNLKFNPDGAGGLGAILFQAMMAFDGHSSVDVLPRHYRIEMLDLDKETGEFTCGILQTFSPVKGWVKAQDPILDTVTRGMFVTKTDRGFSEDSFQGIRMSTAPSRDDIHWYPPMQWYNNNESLFNTILQSLGNTYRTFTSDYDRLFPPTD